MALPDYQPQFTFDQNVADLAGKLASIVAERNGDGSDQYKAQTNLIQAQAKAAKEGKLWVDAGYQRTPELALNPKLRRWVKEASARGRLLVSGE